MRVTTFLKDDSGAVTVDWVILTAAIVGIAIAVLVIIAGGINTTSNEINDGVGTPTDFASMINSSSAEAEATPQAQTPFSAETFAEYVTEFNGDNAAMHAAIDANSPAGFSYSGSYDNATNAPIYLNNDNQNEMKYGNTTTTYAQYDPNGTAENWTFVWSPDNPVGGPTYSVAE